MQMSMDDLHAHKAVVVGCFTQVCISQEFRSSGLICIQGIPDAKTFESYACRR